MSEFVFSDEYCREISAAYWAEEEEMKAGVHPSQVTERIEKALYSLGYQYEKISYLYWCNDGCRVRVHIDGEYFGTFDYHENVFTDTPESRLNDATKDFEINRRY